MNRLQSFGLWALCLLLSAACYAGDKTSYLKKQFTSRSGYQLNYRVLYPLNYDPSRQYPLLLFMHGAGERGSDNQTQLTHGGDLLASYETQTKYPAIVIFPQCPETAWWTLYQRPEKPGEKRVYPYNSRLTEQIAAVKELIDSYIDKGVVDTKRIYVSGLSMGAMATYDLVLRYPRFFAAAAPICGGANLKRLAEFKGKTAFSIYHGEVDGTVDVQFSRDAYKTLKDAGAEVRYKEYPGVDHNSWDNAFAEPDYLSWIFSHHL